MGKHNAGLRQPGPPDKTRASKARRNSGRCWRSSSRSRPPARLRRALAGGLALALVPFASLSLVAVPSASASGGSWYAYAGGEAVSPTSCPETTTTSDQCTLAQALANANAGDTVYLATPGTSGAYVGNWTVSPTGTSASAPLTIKPATGVADPTLSGNSGNAGGCTTSACDGAVLNIGNAYVDIDEVTIEDGDNTDPDAGGALDNSAGGTVSVTGSIFSGNLGYIAGAISNGVYFGTGTLSVAGSTFSGNSAYDGGGAIANGDYDTIGGSGTLSVTGSTFSGNSSSDGGAIDNAEGGGVGTVSVTASTFSGNSAYGSTGDGGAIDNADDRGNATLSVSASTFSGNSAGRDGGAIANSYWYGSGSVSVTASTFSANSAPDGPVISNDDVGGTGTVTVVADIFNGDCDQVGGSAYWDDGGYNVGSDGTCLSSPAATGDVDYDAGLTNLLGPLSANGGPTETIALLGGNPAVGIIPNPTSVTLNGSPVQLCPTTDQRGVRSSAGAACDAGAVQLAPLYAYAAGGAASPASCPETTTIGEQCTLAQALSLAGPGDTVYLATPEASGTYVGNWSVGTTGTSASAPVTLEPAPGVSNPTLDGNAGSASGCTTSSCNGPVLRIGDAYVDVNDVTIEDGHDTSVTFGGAIDNNASGTVSVTGSTFSDDSAKFGGAIDNGDNESRGTLSVTGSTFSGNSAGFFGGAIDNGAEDGTGTLTVTGSTFSGNHAGEVGGAIANGYLGTGTLSVTVSTFSANSAGDDGGAIDNADHYGHGTLILTTSTFSANSAGYDGGAVDNGDYFATGTLSVTSSTFSANSALDGGTVDNGDESGTGTVWAAANIFNGGCDKASGSVWHDEGYNVAGDGSCLSSSPAAGDVDSSLTDLLGPLADNGGPTETMMPLATNPAIGLIPNQTSATLDGTASLLCPTTDQRGVESVSGNPCNAGAVQYLVPLAQAHSYLTTEGMELSEGAGALLAGQSDGNPGATSWTAAVSGQPANGTVSVDANGSFTYTPNAGFVGADSFTYTLTDNLGYTSAPATVTVDVEPVYAITVDGATSATADYGTSATFAQSGIPAGATGTLSFLTNPGGLVLCTLSFPTTATGCAGRDDLAPGRYTVAAGFLDTSSGITSTATGTVELDVTTSPVVASASGTQVYGSSSYKLSYTDNAPAGVGVAGTLSCSSLGGGEPIGPNLTASSYTIDGTSCSGLTLTGTASTDYGLSYVGLTNGFVVTPAPLTVTASSSTFTYGGTVPAITPAYAGFVNGDTPASLSTAPTCSTTATSSSPPGTYPSTCTGAIDANYDPDYLGGTVTVTPAHLTVTASSATFTYGGTVPAITPAYAGFVNGDSPSSLSTAPTCSTTATSSSPPGTYPSTCAGATGPDYAISYVSGMVTVTETDEAPPPTSTSTVTTDAGPGDPFPGAQLTYPNGSVVRFGGGAYVFAGGRAFPASATELEALRKVDHAKAMSAPAGAEPPTATAPRPGTLLSTRAVNGLGTLYVAGADGELHGFSTPRQFFGAGYDAALVVTVPTLAGLRVGRTDGLAGASVTALATKADGAIVDSGGTFYVFAGGRAFGISGPAALNRVQQADKAQVLPGRVGPTATGAAIASGALLSAPEKVYVSYQGALYLFKTTTQLASDGYGGTAAVPVPGPGGLRVVPAYSGG